VERLLEGAVLGLMAALAAIVVLGVVFRKVGAALVWYDEVAAILLAWLTYYGAALAALRRAHIGVPTVFRALRGRPARLAQSVVPIGAVLFVLAEALSIPDALSDPGREASGGEGVPRSPGSELT
jgi:TRAP-type C4-dicarboxylate transport system permease small subunit